MGYERWKDTPERLERDSINYMMPQSLRAFGFPTYYVYINPTPIGATAYEWAVSIPDYIAEILKSKFGDDIIIGPANGFGLHLCEDGLLKDRIEEIFGFSSGSLPYRSREGKIEVNLSLRLNFRFYLVRK